VIDRAALNAALNRVVDPCSNAIGEPLGLVEMGLADDVDVDDSTGTVTVTMRLTSPCCAYGPTMATAAEREIAALPGVRAATVRIDHGAVWTPGEITGTAADRLAERRSRTLQLAGVRPYDWSRRGATP
jgi:metal-sulfur cluster biosynthetic enzyme